MAGTVGFVGVGAMGMPMVGRLVDAGHDVRCYARRPDAGAEAAARGATTVGSAAEAVAAADVAIVCLYTDEQVRALCLGPDGLIGSMRDGTILVTHTTGSPTTAQDLAAAGERRDVRVADAPVDGPPQAVAEGRITVFLGADGPTAAAVTPVLAAYGDPIHHVGPVGFGQRTKLVNNLLFSAHCQLVEDAGRLATALGVHPDVALGAIERGGTGSSVVLSFAVAMGGPTAFATAARPFVAKDVATCEAVAAELGCDTGALGAAARAAARGA
jgi:3-hydroxyisobutyrate dehydrogenase-like beta-hydroxyacid dehydrogenase